MAMEHQEHEQWIHYKVDGEPESTIEKILTPIEIMKNAGFDPKSHYLEQLEGHHDVISYKDDPGTKIEMENGMRFLTKPIGPMPVS